MDIYSKNPKLARILATRVRAEYSYRINFETVGYNNLPKMEEWCGEKCTGLWRSQHEHALYFQFELEKDATMFMLRWATADGNKLR